uniref:Amino acid transporter transmembrane domain-containing protein n=2 Tax=Meloidogyne enterolobii TaxID=390850 RepID=A0A6V7XX34_MELEN|nr:unnamed protein product [Meloidogyne enterolobii]
MSTENNNFEKPPPFIINGNNKVCDENIEEKNLEKSKKKTGLGWFVACLFVVSDMAGGGLVALPTAMIQAGFWTGILLSFLMTLIFMFTSKALGRNWVILRRRWPVYQKHCRQPYPEIGRRAMGKWMGNVVSICVDINQFGTTVVYLLLSAKNIHDTLKSLFDANISFCVLLVILAICLLPITFLNSPQDFWLAAVVAVTTTSLAVILICIGSLLDFGECRQHHSIPEFQITNFFLAVGTLLFAYGGHPAFPTIQNDMRKPEDFEKSSLLSFSILFCMYTPVCIIGYMTYGNSLRESVINSLQHVWIQQIVNLMITLHLIFTIIIVNNPLNQKVEEVFNIPHDFGWKRVVVRTGMMILVLFVAETVPSFGPLLDLMGGSVLMLCSLVFPSLFYLFLNAAEIKSNEKPIKYKTKINGLNINKQGEEEEGEDWEIANWKDVVERTDKLTLFGYIFIIIFGICGGLAATYSAIRSLSVTHFVPPCYLSSIANGKEPNAGGHVNCCGKYQNISVFGLQEEYCSPSNLDFYS